MAEIYGHRWTSSYGDTPPEAWQRALASFSAADIGQGIKTCLTSGSGWPPTLAEFMAFCKPKKRENEAMYRVDVPLLEKKLTDEERERGRAQLAKLRAKLCS